MTIGGLIDVRLTEEVNETDDVDFLGTNHSKHQLKILGRAATATWKANPLTLGSQWFNNYAIALIPTDIHECITGEKFVKTRLSFTAMA